jgi:hypothetical protein
MPDIAYRMFFDNKPATREQLDRMEDITVEQEVDMAWEASIQIPICTDEKGNWTGEDEVFMADFARVRVEIKVGDAEFVPLIDGSIVGFQRQMSSEPGRSAIALTVQDDSIYLNQEDEIFRFENFLDHEIASQIFGKVQQIASTEIETTRSSSSGQTPVVVQRGTKMQLLRAIARRQGMHAYVLPGKQPGESIGCFKKFPAEPDQLPPLILLGAERNVETFNEHKNAQQPSRVQAFALSITDKTITKSTSDLGKLDLLGDEQAFQQPANIATQILHSCEEDTVDLDRLVQAEAERLSYAFDGTGNILTDCYTGVLIPYRVVTVQGANKRSSGNYLISKVTHTLTASHYSQAFTLKRNARSQGVGSSIANLARSIF